MFKKPHWNLTTFLIEFELFQIMHRWQSREFRASLKPRLFIKLDRTRGLLINGPMSRLDKVM